MKNDEKIEITHNDQFNDLRHLLETFWNQRLVIIAITSFFAITSITVSLLIPNEYRSTAVLVPAQTESGLNLPSQLGGLLPMAGLDLGGGSANTDIALEIMKSWKFTETFINKNNLEVELAAVEGWDPDTNTLIIDGSRYNKEKKVWKSRGLFSKKNKSPSSWDLYEEFSKRLQFSKDRLTGHVQISFDYYSPYLAKSFLDSFISEINDHMRKRELKNLTNNILSLQNQIEQTKIAEMKEVLYRIMGDQTKTKLLAEVNTEYAFKIASPPMVPELKFKPTRSIIVIISTLIGGMLALVYVVFSPIIRVYTHRLNSSN